MFLNFNKPIIEASPAIARRIFVNRDWSNAVYKFAFFNGKWHFRHAEIPCWYDLNEYDLRLGHGTVPDEYVKKYDCRYGLYQVKIK